MRLITICSLLLLAVFSVDTAIGATVFTNEANFLGITGSVALESFETLPANPPGSFPRVSSIVSGPLTITNSTATADLALFNQTATPGHATHGANYLVWFAQTSSSSITFTFSIALSAFGANIVDFGYPTHSTPLTFSTNAGDSGVAAIAPKPADNEQFCGIVGAPFTSITFSRTTQADGIIFDELYFRTVPEPGAIALGCVAVVGVAAMFRRRRK